MTTRPDLPRLSSKRLAWLMAVAAIALALVLSSSLARPASAAPIPTLWVVTTTVANDPSDGKCDLWEALQAVFQANFGLSPTYDECTASVGPNVIGFSGAAAGGTISLPFSPGDLPFVHGDTTILGPVTIRPSAALSDTHIFRTAPDATLTLMAVTLSGGHTSGGGAAILDLNHATINIIGSSLTGNIADNDGGAINSNGNVNVVTSNFSGNQAQGLASGAGYGGAIYMDGSGSLKISQSNLAGNIANAGGGAVYFSGGQGAIEDAVFSGNIASPITPTDKGGGAVFVDDDAAVAIVRSAFNGNLSPAGNGGAIYNSISASTYVTDTAFAANLAGDPTHAQLGGAIYAQHDVLIFRSAFANNISVKGDGGALAVDRGGTVNVGNTTLALNGAPLGFGGAIVVTNTQVGGPVSSFIARNVTISTNGAKPPSDHGGGIFVAPGHSATLGNTILDGNLSGNCVGTITSLGHNLDSGTSCNLSGAGDQSNANANLGSPSFNGGPLSSLLTMKLQAGSDAIDKGDNAICAHPMVGNEDQRGKDRPKDGDGNVSTICDIGAYESDTLKPGFGSTPVWPGPINVGNTTFGVNVTTTLSVYNTGDYTLTLTGFMLGGANATEFQQSAPSVLNIGPGAAPVPITIGCTPLGPTAGQRTATLSFATTDQLHLLVLYNLTCNASAAPAPGFGSTPIPPGPIDFSDTIVGDNSNATIKVQETGNLTLTVNSAVIAGPNLGDFSVSGLPFSIGDGGAPKNLTVQCHPSDVGLRTATLTLSTNDTHHASVLYNLACQGLPAPSPYLVSGSSLGNVPNRGLDGAYGVVVSPDGKNVYVTSYLSGTVSSFSRSTTGALSFISQHGAIFNQLGGARVIAMSPDGKNAYVAATTFGTVIQMNRDPITGDLTAVHGNSRADLVGAYGVAVSPDGRFVYATGNISATVVVFKRNPNTGDLSYVQTIASAADLSGARGLTVSPDGANLYVTGYANSATGTLAVYQINPADGKLTHVQTRVQGDFVDCTFICIFGLDGLKGAFQVAVSPDGAQVYLVGTYSGAIVVFRRDSATGKLRHIQALFDNSGGVNGLDGVSGVAVSPDGTHVLATGYNDKAVAVFRRDISAGTLAFEQFLQRNPFSGVGGQPPLNGAREMAISPDGTTAYAAAYLDDAVAVLNVANPIPLIQNISPASATAGGTGFTLTINGANFVSGSSVRFGGTGQPTTFVNSHQLKASISSVLINSTGLAQVKVFNPVPGGGFSNIVTFTISAPNQNPVPSIDHISPQGSPAGGGALTLDVYGANFISGAVVRWNGSNRTTTRLSSTHLQASIPAADVTQPGTSSVTVFNSAPGGGTSNAVSYDVAAPGQNPAPSITSISPEWVFSHGAASSQITLVVNGVNFVEGSTVQLDGVDGSGGYHNRPTKFVSSTQLQATITGGDLFSPGTAGISVTSPAPGGGTSNVVTFTIKPLWQLFVPFVKR